MTATTRAEKATEQHVDATVRASRSAARWRWASRAIFAGLVVAVIVFGGYLGFANTALRDELGESADRLAESQAEAAALYEQLLAAGEDPVVEPSEPGARGEIGPQGVPGIQGVPGDDGRPPTAEEVLAAVNAYCVSVGGCKGADGMEGAPGAPGAAGIPGESGADGIPGESGADGAPGPAGPQGEPGMNGVSILSVSCVLLDDLSTAFRFTFTDGTSSDVPGACLP